MTLSDQQRNSSAPYPPDDFYIRASSVKLPFIAAGLVNSAVAVLLTQLSSRFYEMALFDSVKTVDPTTAASTTVTENEASEPNDVNQQADEAPKETPEHVSNLDDAVDATLEVAGTPIFTCNSDEAVCNIQPSDTIESSVVPSVDIDPLMQELPTIDLCNVKDEPEVEFPSVSTIESDSSMFLNHPLPIPIPTTPAACGEDTNRFRYPSGFSRIATVDYLKRYSCNFRGCNKVFFSRSSLFYHKQVHIVEKPYVCHAAGCNQRFSNETLLRSHTQLHVLNSTHRPFRCQYLGCSKEFINQDRLVEHIRTHTGERPYSCDFPGCMQRFKRRGNLFAHKRIHLDKNQRRQYHCVHPGCGKTFLYSRSLSEHMNVHMGERPYVCDFPQCDKSFTSKSYLYAHRRIHVGADSSRTGGCFSGVGGMSEGTSSSSSPCVIAPPPLPITVTMPTNGAVAHGRNENLLLPMGTAVHGAADSFLNYSFYPDHNHHLIHPHHHHQQQQPHHQHPGQHEHHHPSTHQSTH